MELIIFLLVVFLMFTLLVIIGIVRVMAYKEGYNDASQKAQDTVKTWVKNDKP